MPATMLKQYQDVGTSNPVGYVQQHQTRADVDLEGTAILHHPIISTSDVATHGSLRSAVCEDGLCARVRESKIAATITRREPTPHQCIVLIAWSVR